MLYNDYYMPNSLCIRVLKSSYEALEPALKNPTSAQAKMAKLWPPLRLRHGTKKNIVSILKLDSAKPKTCYVCLQLVKTYQTYLSGNPPTYAKQVNLFFCSSSWLPRLSLKLICLQFYIYISTIIKFFFFSKKNWSISFF